MSFHHTEAQSIIAFSLKYVLKLP